MNRENEKAMKFIPLPKWIKWNKTKGKYVLLDVN
jgi:hypothetical protein